ncbi:cilia- and flagella-associated protein 157-like [Periplaneta americana]|uniref:cilia- and flagella-associated protein 157-like n=1 Tax=Periplaneta americana TaxID=6978 RepID=UPI0037E76A98
MAKKGGKKGGKKKAEPLESDMMTEVEKELFQIQIADLTKKIERLKVRCLELERSNEEYQKRYDQLDEERADIIAFLKKTLQEKEDEITELKERIEGLEKALEEEKQNHKKMVEKLQYEFKITHERLTTEIRLLTGKLNSLEEFRVQREDIIKQFKEREKEMVVKEEKHKRTIHDIETKFIVEKDKLKKEMEARIIQLSVDFQDATHVQMAATTHRAIRENIAVNNELSRMEEMQRILTEENKNLEKRYTDFKSKIKSCEEERDNIISKNMVQSVLIKCLSAEHDEMSRNVALLKSAVQHTAQMEGMMTETTQLLDRAEKQIALLEERLKAIEYENCRANAELLELSVNMYNLQKVLTAAVASVKHAVMVQLKPTSDEDLTRSHRENFLNNLLLLLSTADLAGYKERKEMFEKKSETSIKPVIEESDLLSKSSTDLLAESYIAIESEGSSLAQDSKAEEVESSSKSELLEEEEEEEEESEAGEEQVSSEKSSEVEEKSESQEGEIPEQEIVSEKSSQEVKKGEDETSES